ncbi:DUF6184 family natural product biosynthesis lipoprotein [Pendulispora albinea]|uniref:DUF6184 family natural product biosynthesis lipoprotein n=1 Tax=Pendulispora albinea TaxID=2741071 RepID=A0ABZ2M854_9BACT
MSSFTRYAVPFACCMALVGCDRERSPEHSPGTTTVTGANVPSVANATAVGRIADARCAREATCNNIGTEKAYATTGVCAQKIRADMRDDLNAADCPAGVAPKELDACVAAIKAENCNDPLDKLERITACRTSALCLHPSGAR